MRRPHVFISSRLALGSLRKQIAEILSASGFSVEIYEADSTPSTEPATYLHDIARADFVVFVLDHTYGTARPKTGRSGVHEEWEIVQTERIPNHVYLQRATSSRTIEREQKKFIKEELQAREISYFYYTSKPQLLSQIQKSIVKMAIDVAQSADFRAVIEDRVLASELAKRDHNTFFVWDRAFTTLYAYESHNDLLTDGWASLADLLPSFDPRRVSPFIDVKLQELFANVLGALRAVTSYESQHVVGYADSGPMLDLPYEPTVLHRLKVQPPLPPDYYSKISMLKKAVFEKWQAVRELALYRYSLYGHSSR